MNVIQIMAQAARANSKLVDPRNRLNGQTINLKHRSAIFLLLLLSDFGLVDMGFTLNDPVFSEMNEWMINIGAKK